MKIIFNTNGNDKQKEVAKMWVDKTTTEIVYGGSKNSGKTYLGCSLIFGDAFIYPGTHYFISRESLNDLRKYTMPSIFEVFSHWKIKTNMYNFNGQDNVFTLHNKSKVFFLEAKYLPSDPLFERFGSIQMTRGWIEEGGEHDVNAKSNLSATIGRWQSDKYKLRGKLLITCNPSKNFLYSQFYKLAKTNNLPKHRAFIQALPQDNKKAAKGYLEHLHNTLSLSQKERLLYGNWEFDDDPSKLFEYDDILNLFTNPVKATNEKYLIIDVARYGEDKTVIGYWEGLVCKTRFRYSKQSTFETTEKIKILAEKLEVKRSNICIDEDGVGGGVVDNLSGCKGFVNGSSAIDNRTPEEIQNDKPKPNFANLKTQCYFQLASLTKNGLIKIESEDLTEKELIQQELEQIKQIDIDKDAKIKIAGKDIIKANIGRSPDTSDMLMMRMYYEVQPKKNLYQSKTPEEIKKMWANSKMAINQSILN